MAVHWRNLRKTLLQTRRRRRRRRRRRIRRRIRRIRRIRRRMVTLERQGWRGINQLMRKHVMSRVAEWSCQEQPCLRSCALQSRKSEQEIRQQVSYLIMTICLIAISDSVCLFILYETIVTINLSLLSLYSSQIIHSTTSYSRPTLYRS